MMANIREWQYGLDLSKQIYLSILVTDREVVATLIDAGQRWRMDGYYTNGNAEMELQRLAEEGAERGRGHHIMALLTDSLEYQNGGRVRILAWRMRP
jgi:anti-sigma regulatory factor (Ser/Thr protein kinase)